ncbi:MAG TPA: Sec-independent protein translocase subunit TatA [Jiangellaceae bacterium]
MGTLGWPQILIIAVIIILLFGSRKLPDLARGLGSSLRIFRAETKGMMEDDKGSSEKSTSSDEQPRAVEASQGTPAEPVNDPASESVTDQTKRDS